MQFVVWSAQCILYKSKELENKITGRNTKGL